MSLVGTVWYDPAGSVVRDDPGPDLAASRIGDGWLRLSPDADGMVLSVREEPIRSSTARAFHKDVRAGALQALRAHAVRTPWGATPLGIASYELASYAWSERGYRSPRAQASALRARRRSMDRLTPALDRFSAAVGAGALPDPVLVADAMRALSLAAASARNQASTCHAAIPVHLEAGEGRRLARAAFDRLDAHQADVEAGTIALLGAFVGMPPDVSPASRADDGDPLVLRREI